MYLNIRRIDISETFFLEYFALCIVMVKRLRMTPCWIHLIKVLLRSSLYAFLVKFTIILKLPINC